MVTQPFYAVRVTVEVVGGDTLTRDYVRGEEHIGTEAFRDRAIGNLVALALSMYPNMQPAVKIAVESLDAATVAANRRHQHTSH